jgi:DeoR family transcriptional regulator, suf operon transcriptional repressor
MGASLSETRVAGNGCPPGQRGARADILVELKRAPRASARDLAARLGFSLNAVRHHLRELEAEGLVQHERHHQGVGAPAFAYRLSPSGESLFPRRYEATLLECLDHLVEHEGRDAAVRVLETHFAELSRRLVGQTAGKPLSRRLTVVARAMADEGYMAEAVAKGDSVGTLTEHNCAMHAVAERFPELCAAEARFLESVLGAAVERRSHILAGCGACEYHVRPDPTVGKTEEDV